MSRGGEGEMLWLQLRINKPSFSVARARRPHACLSQTPSRARLVMDGCSGGPDQIMDRPAG